jgi:hypothetical protein
MVMKLLGVGLIFFFSSLSCYSADTIEVYGLGFSDLEQYFSVNGMGSGGAERSSSAQFIAGYGLTNDISGYVSISGVGNQSVADSASNASAGAIVKFYDNYLFKIHGLLDVSFDKVAQPMIDFGYYPNHFGAYTRLGMTFIGGVEGVHFENFLVLGVRYLIADGHEVLTEMDLCWKHVPSPFDEFGVPNWEMGKVALGYNVVLTNSMELITEISFDLPSTRVEKTTVGLMTGLVISLQSN